MRKYFTLITRLNVQGLIGKERSFELALLIISGRAVSQTLVVRR